MDKKVKLRPFLPLTQETLAIVIKAAAIIFATVTVFFQDLDIIFNDALHTETTSHVLAVPFILAYLIYRKRKMLRAAVSFEEESRLKETKHLPLLAGILLFAAAILLYWHGSYTFTPLEYHIAALPIFVAALTLILFNPQTLRHAAFPIAFLIFLTPPPSEILYTLGATLSTISSEASNAMVNALGVPSTLSSEYGTPIIMITRPNATTISFAVDIACSGVYSLIGFLIFSAFIAYIIRDKPWKKLALFTVGLPLIYLLNIIRITLILLIGYNFGEEIALQIFHLLGGWTLIFLGTLLLLVVSEKIFKTQIFTKPTEKCPKCNPKTKHSFCFTCGKILTPASARLLRKDTAKIVAVAIVVVLMMSIQVPVFALTQGPPMVIVNTPSGQQASTDILPEISGYRLDFVYRDTEFEERAKQDMALVYLYAPIGTPVNQSNKPLWVTIEIASTRSSLHGWETCLIEWGMRPVTQITLKEVQLIENPPIFGRYFVFRYKTTNETQAVLYWFETTTFTINTSSQQKHVKISLIAYPDSLEDLTSLENQLPVVATAIAGYWQPIKTWSQIAMLLSQNGDNLVTATIAMLAGILALSVFKRRKQRKANFQTYKKLSKPNKQIIDATHETEKRAISTLSNIAIVFQNKTGHPVDKEKLLHELSALEKIGILRKFVANRNDEPILTWKTQMNFE